jgi:hypothetical protein
MLAISLHQPWASMIAAGIKRFETRAYPPPKSFEIGGWIAIHAAKKRIADMTCDYGPESIRWTRTAYLMAQSFA